MKYIFRGKIHSVFIEYLGEIQYGRKIHLYCIFIQFIVPQLDRQECIINLIVFSPLES